MPLVTVDLATPAVIRGRWAAFAAARPSAASTGPRRDDVRHYDEVGSNRADPAAAAFRTRP